MNHEKIKLEGIKESQWALNVEAACRKVGFIALLLIIFAALIGMFSGGYLSTGEKTNTAQSLKIEYERFGRLQTEFHFKISTPPDASGKYVFRLGGDFNRQFEMENIWPQPDSMYSQDGALYLVYNTMPPHSSPTLWLYVTPIKPGRSITTLRVNHEPEIRFWQLIYP